jgi:hypothetical protein
MMRPVAFAIVFALMPFAAAAQTISVSPHDCQQLVAHVPGADVEYKPGVDVHGNAVAPADLGGGSQLDLPQSIDIAIGVDLADRLGLRDSRRRGPRPTRRAVPFAGYGYAPLGTLTIAGNDAFWNGNRIGPQDEVVLADACRKSLSAAGITLPTPKPPAPH